MDYAEISSYVALGLLIFLITFGTVSAIIANPINSLIRLALTGVFIALAYVFVKFADHFANKQLQKNHKVIRK